MGNVARSLIEGVPVALKSGAGVDIQRGTVLVGELLQGKLLGLKASFFRFTTWVLKKSFCAEPLTINR